MLKEALLKLYLRDLDKLKTEIESYSHESRLWVIDKAIANSGGNLCLHLIGNLNTYIGQVLGQTDYVRNRELEFSDKNVPRSQLIERITATRNMIEKVLPAIADEQLAAEYPVIVFADKMTTEYFLMHLATHLSYHLGQINYHRRLLDY